MHACCLGLFFSFKVTLVMFSTARRAMTSTSVLDRPPPCSSEAASCTNTDGSFTCDEGVGTSACNNNGVCEAWAEDCLNCPNDCNDKNSNHCCGRTNKNSNSKPCGHPVCTSGSFQCRQSSTRRNLVPTLLVLLPRDNISSAYMHICSARKPPVHTARILKFTPCFLFSSS